MKILMISHEYPPVGGGGANACMKLSAEYRKQGHEVTVVTVWFEGLEKEEKREGLYIIRVPSKRKNKEHCSFLEMISYLLKSWIVCEKLEREKRFDICQVFFAIPSGPIGFYLKWRYKLPYVIRFGGGDVPGFQDRFQMVYKLIGPFEKVIWKYADALVANSDGLKKMAEGFYSRKEILIIPNGADVPSEVAIEKRNIGSEECRILFVSRLIERKGLQHVLPQLQNLQKRCSGKIQMIVVGDGPYRNELEKIVECCGIKDMVTFAGQKEKHELPQYYSNAEIFILPSQKEGMPNVVLEAMSYGLPIVMTPCEGSKELIHENGYAVPVEEFTECLTELCNNEVLREDMGKRSRVLIENHFLWSQTADKYLKLMENILNKKG